MSHTSVSPHRCVMFRIMYGDRPLVGCEVIIQGSSHKGPCSKGHTNTNGIIALPCYDQTSGRVFVRVLPPCKQERHANDYLCCGTYAFTQEHMIDLKKEESGVYRTKQ